MDTITLLVNKAKNGDQEAQKELILQMTPLLRKYASKIHFMEFDDSIQELSLSLIECIPYLDPDKGQAKLLKYIQESIIHKYYALCKKYLSAPELISLDSENSFNIAVSGPDIFMENELSNDLLQYISKLSKEDSKKGQILYLAVFKNLSDKEISQIMNLSRQYINRIKKSLIASFLENYN